MKTTIKIAVITMMGMSLGVKGQVQRLDLKAEHSSYNQEGIHEAHLSQWNRLSLGLKSENNSFSIEDWRNGSSNIKSLFTVKSTGEIGIGTTSPQEKFQIGNSYLFHDGGHKVIGFLHKPSGGIDLDNTRYSAEIRFDPANGNFRLGTSSTVTSNPITHFNIDKNGKIGIGTNDTGNHKLAVEGSIGAREIKVEASGWSDFVFYKDYKLPTLKEVENHIKEKGHLKDIPSAKEVEKNGFFLGGMDAKLLQKIEELTLYTIEQEKKIKSLEKQNSKIDKQQKDIEKLKILVKQLLKDKN